MNLVYNSDLYTVYEFGMDESHEVMQFGGYEIMNKYGKQQIFIDGQAAVRFRQDVLDLIASKPSIEDIDEFLCDYDVQAIHKPATLH